VRFPHPLLLCDIGGTNVRFALAPTPGAPLIALGAARTAQFAGLAPAARAHLPKDAPTPRSMMVCAAGPANGRLLALTNAHWIIDGPETARELGLEQGLTLNDFEALAFALPTLEAAQVRRIGPALPGGPGPRLALGPGTGLGVAALAEIDGRYVAISSEAGHMDFAPADAQEAALWAHVARPHGRVSAETLISGPGLERLYAAACAQADPPPGDPTARALSAAQITQEGLAGPGLARESLRLLWRLVARFAGDMTLAFLARGGVTLAGGVLPRIVSLLDDAAFRAAFENKEPMGAILRDVETQIIVADHAALVGMAAIGAAPQRYAIDYGARLWR
jgi:glucokinase